MRRVVFNQKGGVGKTSITCNLAAISAHRGLRTLVIDLDTQCNSSEYLVGDEYKFLEDNATAFFKQQLSAFGKKRDTIDFIYETPFENLCLMPASPELANIERELESRHKIYKLRNALDKLKGQFDRIYIDTPPALNFYSRSALIATDGVLVPFDCDTFSRQALYNLIETINEIQEDHNNDLKLEGVVVNQFQPQAKLPAQLIEEMIAEGLPLIDAYLPSSVKIKESREQQKPLIYSAPSHKLTQAYVALFEKIENK